MAEQQLTELIDHNPKPFCDLDGHPEEGKSGLAGCLGFAAVLGAVCGFGLFLLLVWMEG